MTSLAHVHLRALWRLAAQYGDDDFRQAAETAQGLRAFNAHSVRRLLERSHPVPPSALSPDVAGLRGCPGPGR